MEEKAYVVVVLETESDDPGLVTTIGPFPSYEAADSARDEVARMTQAEPSEIQVHRLQSLGEELGL